MKTMSAKTQGRQLSLHFYQMTGMFFNFPFQRPPAPRRRLRNRPGRPRLTVSPRDFDRAEVRDARGRFRRGGARPGRAFFLGRGRRRNMGDRDRS